MNPGRRVKCPDCGWWGGHAMSCPEMSKPVPRSGLRDEPLFEWVDPDPNDPAVAARLAQLGAGGGAVEAVGPGGAAGPADGRMRAAGAAVAGRSDTRPDATALQAEAAGLGGKGVGTLLAEDIARLEASSAEDLAIEAPDLSNVGAKEVKAQFRQCALCKIKVPEADAERYAREKKCPISRANCPFTADIEELGGPAAASTAAAAGTGGSGGQPDPRVLRATLATGQSRGPVNLAGYEDVSEEKDRSVRKRVVRAGRGDATPPHGADVSVHYVGSFPQSGDVFDSSRRAGVPFAFTVGERGVIRGWSEAVVTMRLGEVASFFIAPAKAYGKTGHPLGAIPPNAPLMFEIELLQWTGGDGDSESSVSSGSYENDGSDDEKDAAPAKAAAGGGGVGNCSGDGNNAAATGPADAGKARGGRRGRGGGAGGCELQIMVVAVLGILMAVYAAHVL